MKQKILFILLSTTLLGWQFSCQKPVKTAELPVIDISKKYPTKEIHLQNVADIEYIPLETTDNILLSGSCVLVYFSDNYIIIRDVRQNCVFVFNRNGEIITHLNRRGQGDKEYNNISGVVFDEKTEEIFIVDIFSTHRILVYSLTGEYRRTLKYPDDLRILVCNFDDETLLVYDESGLLQQDADSYREKPYLLLSKKDGSIVADLDIHLPVRYSRRMYFNYTDASGQQMTNSITISMNNNKYYGQDFVIADIFSDTIYKLTKTRELTPLIVRMPSVHTSDPRTVWASELTTDRFILFSTLTMDFNVAGQNINQGFSSIPSTDFIYEFETGETNEVLFVNDDFSSGSTWKLNESEIPQKNVAASVIQLPALIEALKEKKLKGELEKLVDSLDEDDNPIVMIVKFK